MVFHPLAERLRRDIDAAEHLAAPGRPGFGAAVEHGDAGAGNALQPAGQPFGEPTPVIDAADAHRAPRQ